MLNRKNAGTIEGTISIIINFIIFVAKLIIGIYSHSIAIITDAIHTLSDDFSSIFLIIATKISNKGADEEHPFGHSRMEIITSMVIAFLLFFTAFEMARAGVNSLIHPRHLAVRSYFLYIILGTMLLKELMAQIALYIGKRFNNEAIKVDGYHHRSDMLSSIPIIFVLLFDNKFKWLDGASAILISIFIGYFAIGIIIKSINKLLGEAPSNKIIHEIKLMTKKSKHVYGCHDITIHSYGDINILTLHLEVEDNLDLYRAHAISEEVEEKLKEKFAFADVVVHIDPLNYKDEQIMDIKKYLNTLFKDEPFYSPPHDIRVVGSGRWKKLIFNINLIKTIPQKEIDSSINEIKGQIKKDFKEFNIITIAIDQPFN
ncbi:cation transporter, partial [bacterium]|nr:cation transporter [bacterium]